MDEIERAIRSIETNITTNKMLAKRGMSELSAILEMLISYNKLDSPKKEWARLISRHINRLMNYNEWLLDDFWKQFRCTILCAMDETIGKKVIDKNWNRFNQTIDFETKLEYRELQFKQKMQEQKHWKELFSEHKAFFEEYLQKCISFHSKMKLENLIENIDDLIYKIYGLTQNSISSESQKHLEEKLQCIEVNFDCLNRSFKSLDSQFYMDNNINGFQPSVKQMDIDEREKNKQITDVLIHNRWITILGDPGSAKTTLLRWITSTFADLALNGHDYAVLEENRRIPIRIPILIRMGEFTVWLEQNRTKTLLDYIGEHTWFTKRYCHDDNKNVLKELIYHGHALILLDGLDEITEVERRRETVDLVRKFVDEYVLAPDFYSPFDDKIYTEMFTSASESSLDKMVSPMDIVQNEMLTEEMFLPHQIDYLLGDISAMNSVVMGVSKNRTVTETQPPSIPDGNQIIITSRIVGYQLCPLIGPFIHHYSLLMIDHNKAKEFVKKHLAAIEKSVLEILCHEGIQFDETIKETVSKRRDKSVEAMFKNDFKISLSNPHLLSLICIHILQSLDEFLPKSRIEIYHHAVQASLRSWKSHQSNISEKVLVHFFINLACYLYMNSPSGLIDEFDTRRLCYLVLKKEGLSNNRQILNEYVTKMIYLLDFSTGIIAERGLQIFGFLHLSFEEYFVAHSFLNGSPDEISKRILDAVVYSRFREPLLLAIGWISWKWSFNDYDKFCHSLVTSPTEYSIPFGTILFFDAFNDIQKLPSNSVIFVALNNILDHPYYPDPATHLIPKLLKLNTSIIIEWMQSQLKDERRLVKFCQFLLSKIKKVDNHLPTDLTSIFGHVGSLLTGHTDDKVQLPSIIYQQLWLLRNMNRSVEFMIDRTLQTLIKSSVMSKQIFNKNLSLYLSSMNICINNIHPLIITIIIALCGGIVFKNEGGLIMIDFSIRQMYGECSVLMPIIEYLDDTNESHSIKMQRCIEKYEYIIQQSSFSDCSNDIIDSFVALICLQGVYQIMIYQKYLALQFALDKLKCTWFNLKNSCEECVSNENNWMKVSLIKYQVESLIRVQSNQSNDQLILYSMAYASACKKLGFWNLSIWFSRDYFYQTDNNDEDFQDQRPLTYLMNERTFDEMINIIHSQQLSNEKLRFLIHFLPESLQQLYYYAIITSTTEMTTLLPIILLSECLINFEQSDEIDENHYLGLILLYPIFQEYKLEKYAFTIFHRKYTNYTTFLDRNYPEFIQMLQHYKLFDSFRNDQSNNLQTDIQYEHQRIQDAMRIHQTDMKDIRLFAASISYARLLQIPNHSHEYDHKNEIIINLTNSKQIYSAIMNISNPIVRISALSIILDMKDPLILDEEQRDELQNEILIELLSLISESSLLIASILFIRCYKILHHLSSQQLSYILAEKFYNSINKQDENIEAVFIALKQLNNSHLSHCLSEFIQQKQTLSDLCLFKSTIFFRYIRNTTSFDSSNTVLLSLMYLLELIFDSQILRINHQEKISPMKELQQLWNESSTTNKVMTNKVAIWITNNLEKLNREDQNLIIENVSNCLRIERKALVEIEQWLNYRTDEVLKFFSHYAALQLFIHGSNNSDLIEIINEMLVVDHQFRLEPMVQNFIRSPSADLHILRQMFILLHKNMTHYSFSIHSIRSFELFLDLELERITLKTSSNSFLSIIEYYSRDFQSYLLEHFHLYLNFSENIIQDRYLAVIIKWMNKNMTSYNTDDDIKSKFLVKLFKFIFVLPNKEQFPLVLQVVFETLDLVFRGYCVVHAIFFQNDLLISLEEIIYSRDEYSEDVLAACLLTYGHYLLNVHKYKIRRNISDDFKQHLLTLSQTSISDVISIRANFCLIFISYYSNVTSTIISNWFTNQLNITAEMRYKILLQQTLYYIGEPIDQQFINELIDQLKLHSTQLLDLFVIDLYNHLRKMCEDDYHFDFTPNYIRITAEIHSRKWNEFRHAIQRSSFGEENFKRKLFLSCKKHPEHCKAYINIYAHFGVITDDLVGMCAESKRNYMYDFSGNSSMECLKEVSDRHVIDNLFQKLNSTTNDKKFRSYLWILEYLAKNNLISLLEVHSRVQLLNNIQSDDDTGDLTNEQYIFKLLLENSCYKGNEFWQEEKISFDTNNIDEKFEKIIGMMDQKFILCIRRNQFY